MKIAILHDAVPFTLRPSDRVAHRLAGALQLHGHDARVMTIPGVADASARLLASTLVVHGAERVVGLTFPAFLISAPGAERIIWSLEGVVMADSDAHFRELLTASRLFCATAELQLDLLHVLGLRAVLLQAPEMDDDGAWSRVAEELGS